MTIHRRGRYCSDDEDEDDVDVDDDDDQRSQVLTVCRTGAAARGGAQKP